MSIWRFILKMVLILKYQTKFATYPIHIQKYMDIIKKKDEYKKMYPNWNPTTEQLNIKEHVSSWKNNDKSEKQTAAFSFPDPD